MQTDVLSRLVHPPRRLWTRTELLDAVTGLHAQPQPHGYSLILFSIDRFKLVNNRFGPARADAVLRHVGAIALRALNGRGAIGRWGGDEYMCILPNTDASRAIAAAERLRARIAAQVIPVGAEVATVTCSFGVATYPQSALDVRALLAAADSAAYEAKRTGRNRVLLASIESLPQSAIGALVEAALREERIMPAYQPIFDLRTGKFVAEEALARLITPDEQLMIAGNFIDAASQLQLTPRIDATVMRCALLRLARRSQHGGRAATFVNVSGGLLNHPGLIKQLATSLSELPAGAAAKHRGLVLEMTERELFGEPHTARALLAPLIDAGAALALDDFGSGYSSLHYLADLPISYIKIDGRLVRRLHESRIRAIIRGIQRTASDLGLTTLAEYVEHERQANVLREIGVDWAQGHYFGEARLDETEPTTRRHLNVNFDRGCRHA